MRRILIFGGLTTAVALAVAAVLLVPSRADAVPSFARRYGTSCQTCHVAFPKLTPFGESFRRNGYRFPGGLDEDYRRQQPQMLGADAYKDVFPQAVWPGDIPGGPPLSAIMGANLAITPDAEPYANLAGLGGSLSLNAATPMGEAFSVWAGASFSATTDDGAAVDLERVFLVYAPLKTPQLRFRVGRFEPSVMGFSSHRMFGYAPWVLTRPIGDNEFALESTQLGLEAEGVVGRGRLAYAAGYVEGAGNGFGIPRDAYARLVYKIAGMRLDGEVDDDEEEVSMANPAPWREWSAQIGAFGYAGFPTIGDPDVASQFDQFFMVGGDVTAQLYDATVIGSYAYRKNQRPFLRDPLESAETHDVMGQLEYVIFPWWIPMARYELRTPSATGARQRISAGMYFLARANIRAQVLARVEESENDGFKFGGVDVGLRAGF